MNHLLEAKGYTVHARKASGKQGTFADIAQAHALIAIAEQLERMNTTMIDVGIAKGLWDGSCVEEDR